MAVQLYVAFGVLRGSVLVWIDAPQRLPAARLVRLHALGHWCVISEAVLDVGHGEKVPTSEILPAAGRAQPQGSSRRLLEIHGSQGVLGSFPCHCFLTHIPQPWAIPQYVRSQGPLLEEIFEALTGKQLPNYS